jgi:uncharacterized membrane protein (DUF2068 family)
MPKAHEKMPNDQGVPANMNLAGVRAVALLEAGKGLLALLAGSGLLLLWNADLQTVGNELLRHLHLNPGRMHGHVLWEAMTSTSHGPLHLIALGVLCYSMLRFVEAGGLWQDRRWAEWLGVLSGGIYVPFEVRELLRHPGLLSVSLLTLNVLIVGYLVLRLSRRRRNQPHRTEHGNSTLSLFV